MRATEPTYALTKVTVVNYNEKIENATIVVQNGKIVNVGVGIPIPKSAVIYNLEGKYAYPSFIDLYTNYGLKEVKNSGFNWAATEKIKPQRVGAYNANDAVRADFMVSEAFHADTKKAESWRKAGFGALLTHRPDGIVRGVASVVSTGEGSDNTLIMKSKASTHYSFSKGSSKQDFPVSLMGGMALLRQTYYDAKWYKTYENRGFTDNTLDAFNQYYSLPKILEAKSWSDILRVKKLAKEFNDQFIVKTVGTAYQSIEDIKKTGSKLIVPVDFPEGYEVEDAFAADDISYKQLKHWEWAASNPAILVKNGIDFAITSQGSGASFMKNMRKAIERGLSEKQALKALTYNPAAFVGLANKLGQIKTGYWANIIVSSDKIFDQDAKILAQWIQGKPYVFYPLDLPVLAPKYELNVGEKNYTLEVSLQLSSQLSSSNQKLKATIKSEEDSSSISASIKLSALSIDISFEQVKLSGWFSGDDIKGIARLGDGTTKQWSAKVSKDTTDTNQQSEKKKDTKEEEKKAFELSKMVYPFSAYGYETVPTSKTTLFKNATVWTNEQEGILENTDVLVRDGKISKIAKDIKTKADVVIDATGKHLTSGIVDEHSHIALINVNDVATVSSMCRMNDAVDAEDVDIYRQLAGGVTTAQLLHGSANPIGGQSALVKMKWGKSADEMIIDDADGYIKFALGENVKRSWKRNSIRYPRTRMGVEQIFEDMFNQAKAYNEKWDAYNKLSSAQKERTAAPRRDVTLDPLAEILKKERFITCHSYVQSEISMLMKLAERFGFRVNTFTHILEGYKVADKMAKHGAGGSTFSDWWAYKMEVQYAIPYNPILMHDAGVVVAINSDDAEMGRRLNQEAAKSVKYGSMSEQDAWKMVSLNPAKLLHLDDKIGSIKKGKDADLVLWSGSPLSVYSKAEKTMIEGVIYYDREVSKLRKDKIREEKASLISKMLGNNKNGRPVKKTFKKKAHCDFIAVY